MTTPFNTLNDDFVHLHVHYEYSLLDGLSKVKDIINEAVHLGQKAVGMTDHGVMGGIADFITQCNKIGIKPIPGCETYITKNRLVQSEKLKKMRESICLKYGITSGKVKKKAKLKVLGDFIRKVERDWDVFEEEAMPIIKDYLMGSSSQSSSKQFDLFDIDLEEETKPNDGLEEFKNDIMNYLEYDNYHMVMLAVNNQGLEDLYEIVSDAHINGFYSDPRTDLSFIRKHGLGKNIIATSACLGSYFAKLVDRGQIERAKEHIKECKETFHSFYLEKQATTIPKQLELNDIIDQLAEETNTPKIVTTDVHFCKKEDWETHDVLVAASTNKCLGDPSKYTYAKDHYMKSLQEIREIVNDDEAIANTIKITEMINVSLPKEPLFPKFIIEGNETAEELLRKKAWNGLIQYLFKHPEKDAQKYSMRLDYELGVICNEGFSDYFLIEEDMIRATNEAGYLTGPGRGSAAGSLVAFCISITTLDPIENDLLFERFLNPERAGYPDIDTDFSYAGARWVQMYLKDKYGKDKVAQIGTYGTLAARAVIRAVAKTMGYDLRVEDQFAKSIPAQPNMTLSKAYDQEEKVRGLAEQYPKWWETAKKLEGHIRSEGVHASGIVISPEPLTKVTPLRTDSEGLETTQYDMEWIENYLVKFDVLKLDTLDLIKKTMEYAGLWGNMSIEDIPLNDPFVYQQVYQQLDLGGIFQCESKLFVDIIKNLKPTCFEDISVIVALGRPGPLDLIPSYVNRKFGREEITYPFPELEPVLKETYGIYVYQEQVMKSSQILGGLTLGQADMIRKGVAKKKPDLMGRWIELMIYGSKQYKEIQLQRIQQYPKEEMIPHDAKGDPICWVDYKEYENKWEGIPNIEGALARGYNLDALLDIQKQWIAFGNYCFNKAHSAAYAKISVITAWLKAYYPTHFMAALLTMSEGKKDSKSGDNKQIKYMEQAEGIGIKILPADINQSAADWTPHGEEKTIRYGLSSIAGISTSDYEVIKSYRPFNSFDHFLTVNSEKMKLNKTKMGMLIKSGAFDSLNPNRNLLLRNYFKDRGDEYEHIPNSTSKRTIMEYEIECFGTSITVKSRWSKIEDGAEGIQITGHVTMFEEWTAKTGKTHGKAIIATQEDARPVIIWGYILNKQGNKDAFSIGNKVELKGKKSKEDLIVSSIKVLDGPMLDPHKVDLN